MAINFPATPTANQLYTYNGNVYRWDGSKWRKASVLNTPIITEYTNRIAQTSSAISIDPAKYNYYKVTVDNDPTITIPNANPYTSFILELNYTTSTTGYDISNASYDNVSFNVSGQDTTPLDVTFKTDGTKMYMVGDAGNTVDQYSLSTAWDLSTASYDSVTFALGFQEANPSGIFFKPDGTKMYIIGYAGDDVNQYTLSTAWDLSTASYDSVSFSVASQDSAPTSVFFKNDGTKMYISGFVSDNVYQYSLSTAWDLSTASYDSVSFSVASQDATPRKTKLNDSGDKMFMVGGTNSIYQYSLSTAWDLSTASYDSVSFLLGTQDTAPTGFDFGNNGTKLYMVGNTNNSIFQYSTGSAVARTVIWGSNIQWAGGTAPTIDYTYSSNIIIHFYTTDGVNWIGSPLSLDSRSS